MAYSLNTTPRVSCTNYRIMFEWEGAVCLEKAYNSKSILLQLNNSKKKGMIWGDMV